MLNTCGIICGMKFQPHQSSTSLMTPNSVVRRFVGWLLTVRLSLPVAISSLLLSGAIFAASWQSPYLSTLDRAESATNAVVVISDCQDSGPRAVSSSETSISAAPISGSAPAHLRQSYRSTAEYRWTFEIERFSTCSSCEVVCDVRENCQLSLSDSPVGMKRPTLVTLGIRLQA